MGKKHVRRAKWTSEFYTPVLLCECTMPPDIYIEATTATRKDMSKHKIKAKTLIIYWHDGIPSLGYWRNIIILINYHCIFFPLILDNIYWEFWRAKRTQWNSFVVVCFFSSFFLLCVCVILIWAWYRGTAIRRFALLDAFSRQFFVYIHHFSYLVTTLTIINHTVDVTTQHRHTRVHSFRPTLFFLSLKRRITW